ncbi:hypothetical protein EYF80_061215 [Liparis tanakae]|uniref:Uncharacterized protein n=1 Tax=Liparis tanakae TaxID=230148 RepID=A0A4Z2EIQ2_9TELE|nr:hypothetical protein EYF80_061215 [Liparis tanakae]
MAMPSMARSLGKLSAWLDSPWLDSRTRAPATPLNSPEERDDQLDQLGARDHLLVEDVKTPQEVVVRLGAPESLLHLGRHAVVNDTDLLEEHGFGAGAVFAHFGHAVVLPQ